MLNFIRQFSFSVALGGLCAACKNPSFQTGADLKQLILFQYVFETNIITIRLTFKAAKRKLRILLFCDRTLLKKIS